MDARQQVLVDNPDLLAFHVLREAEREAGRELPETGRHVAMLFPVFDERGASDAEPVGS